MQENDIKKKTEYQNVKLNFTETIAWISQIVIELPLATAKSSLY